MNLAQWGNQLIKIVVMLFLSINGTAQDTKRPFIDPFQYKRISVKPSATNPAITAWDTAHVIYYDPVAKSKNILLWLTGTNGTTNNIPVEFFKTALDQGYRVIALSFISTPAVAQICTGDMLDSNTGCAAEFRRKRIYGDNDFSLISDEPQDAIIPRLVKLLQWLVENDTTGNWSQWLDKKTTKPVWNKIAIAGQSQGGGMAAFMGQQETLVRVISFSGGWDYSNSKEKKIAGWYFNRSATPMADWYATYHINEMAAKPLSEICTALQIPAAHVFALDKPLLNPGSSKERANAYHGEGIRNTAYKQIWITMLGSGID
ncbi:MAG: hypothetical protein ABI741_01395 [Ferruginibacter sp.]